MPTYVVIGTEETIATADTVAMTLTWSNSSAAYLGAFRALEGDMETEDNVDYVLGPTSWVSVYESVYAYLNATMGSAPDTATVNQYAIRQLPSMLQDYVAEVFNSSMFGYSLPAAIAAPYIDYIINYMGGTVGGTLDNGTGEVSCTYAKLTVIMIDEPMSQTSMDTLESLQGTVDAFEDDESSLVSGTWVTGNVAAIYEISQTVNDEFDYIEIGVVVLIFLLLFFVMGSYLTPLRAILTIMMSVAWTIGLTHLLFTGLLGTPVTWIVPIVLLVICLGLGMDYDILLTTRIKENVRKGMSNDEAITHAIERSGAVITICGLIMSGAFGTMMLSSSPMLQEFGFALGFAILVDALVVRTYIVPALMHLIGDWNWKGPKFLSRRGREEA